MTRSRSVCWTAALAVAVLAASGGSSALADDVAAVVPVAAGAAGDGDGFLPDGQVGAGSTQSVTLITGDRVWLTRSTDDAGRTSVSTRIEQAPRPGGAKVSFAQWGSDDQYYVVPTDVLPLIGARVDRRIFDVAGLIDSGATEASPTRVIVTLDAPASASRTSALDSQARALASLVDATDITVLPSADAVALSVPAGKVSGLLSRLPGGSRDSSARATFVSLDARVKAMDGASMPQIGAPKAWESGYTGKGVKVAVLDTGIDSTHPDLKGQVVAEKNFSSEDSAGDRRGHGTHVASIIAGTGAASNRSMRGVAYEAKLLNGKVLGDDGGGYNSDVIEGMEWAAKSGADVINMSLGGGPGDGSDPVETSLNTLSKQYGVVFAVAAGNGGRIRERGVTSPSSADAAISVAAVDSNNERASFSDTGPRRGDSALKPDVAAPGVKIRAARSKVNQWGSGSSPYVRLSGTSMAAPHVAGAAAVLAQARPDLSGPELKAVLMGGATKREGTVWEEGAGTIDIPGSIGMPVIAAEGSLSFGQFAYPQSALEPVTKTIHYRNTGAEPVTLTLSSEVRDAKGRKAKGLSLSATTVTVPAKGNAEIPVTVTPGADRPGIYAGAITAVPNRGHAIRTTLGWDNGEQLFTLTIKGLDHSGKVGDARGIVANLDKPDDSYPIPIAEPKTLRVPAGAYFVGGFIFPKDESLKIQEVTIGTAPEVRIAADATVTIGGRAGRGITVATPKPSTPIAAYFAYERTTRTGDKRIFVGATNEGLSRGLWVTPAASPNIGRAAFLEQVMLAGPGTKPAYDYQLAFATRGRIPATSARRVGPKQLAASVGTYRSPVANASATAYWRSRPNGAGFSTLLSRDLKVPATVTSYVLADGLNWMSYADGPRRELSDGERYAGSGWRTFRGNTTQRADYLSPIMSPGAVTGGAAYRLANRISISLPYFEDSGGHLGVRYTDAFDSSLVAYVGSRRVLTSMFVPSGSFAAPSQGGTLRIVQKERRGAPDWKTNPSMTGEWVAPLPTKNARVVPLLNVQYHLAGQNPSGSVPPGKQTLGLSVTTFPNPKYFRKAAIAPASLTLEFSTDRGKTWKRAKVARSGKKATATFLPPGPKPGGTVRVSLRATASDGNGSTVTETIIDAYEMRGPAPGAIADRP